MKKAIVTLKSQSPYNQSRFHNLPKLEKELADDYEKRTWKEKGHYNDDGFLFIPPTSLSNSLKEAAKYLSIQIPGKGKSTYTKHFLSGVLVVDPLVTEFTRDTVTMSTIHANADGIRGSGKRVLRHFPTIPHWSGVVEYFILDDIITKDIFTKVLQQSGLLIGIGQFRPGNGGYCGRYIAEKIEWIDSI